VFFGAIAGWIILSHSYPAGDKNWAYTTVGTILASGFLKVAQHHAACHVHRLSGSIHLFRSPVHPDPRNVMAGLALVFDRGDRLIIDSIDEDAIPNAVPLIEPVCGAHLDLDTET
jgi:hypothetical protein